MSFQATKTVSDVLSDVKRTFGDEASVQVTDADVIRWVNQAQVEIVSKNQILTSVATTASVANQYVYDLSALNIQSISSIHYNGVKLDYMSFQEAEEYILRNDPLHNITGVPQFWYQWADEISFY